jgi:hypothetical protein
MAPFPFAIEPESRCEFGEIQTCSFRSTSHGGTHLKLRMLTDRIVPAGIARKVWIPIFIHLLQANVESMCAGNCELLIAFLSATAWSPNGKYLVTASWPKRQRGFSFDGPSNLTTGVAHIVRTAANGGRRLRRERGVTSKFGGRISARLAPRIRRVSPDAPCSRQAKVSARLTGRYSVLNVSSFE